MLTTSTMMLSSIIMNDGLYATDASPMLGFIDESQLTAGISAAAAINGASCPDSRITKNGMLPNTASRPNPSRVIPNARRNVPMPITMADPSAGLRFANGTMNIAVVIG